MDDHKNIVNNWRLELSLLLGLSMGVGIVTAIPIYSSGSLQDAYGAGCLPVKDAHPTA